MTFADQVIQYHKDLQPNWRLPKDIGLIYPFREDETWAVFEAFYHKYFGDEKQRTVLFGINPGRFGAGVTGIPFTDPKILEEDLKIKNTWQKRNELSSVFVYEMIKALGGPKRFYKKYYITSVCPLGFISQGKNVNYYDDKALQDKVEKKIIAWIKSQLEMPVNKKVAFSMGQGKNYKYLAKLNEKHNFFDAILPLPHPRWVMQYRLKSKEIYIDEYVMKLSEADAGSRR